jgi:hypothetical protein
MWFLYGELLALILGSFVVGSVLTRTAVRVLVRRTEAGVTDNPVSDFIVTSSGVVR